MITDVLMQVSDAQALTATAFSDKSIDLGNPTTKRRVGTGKPIEFFFQTDVSADHTTGNETYQVDLVQSDNADLSTPDVLESQIVVYSDLVAGKIWSIGVPAARPTKRHIGLQYTLGGTSPTWTVTAGLIMHDQMDSHTDYASGFAIS
jgi:hypothetical protein